MVRHLACLSALLLAAVSAHAQSLKLQMIAADGDFLVGEEEIMLTRYVTQQRIRTVNGRDETYSVAVPVVQMVRQKVSYRLKDVTVLDLDGLKVDPDKVPELLKRPRPVVISWTGKIDRSLREALKDGTLVVVPPATPAPPRGPAATAPLPPPPPPIPGVPVKPEK